MAIAIAGILQESNNFSPVKTRYEDFKPVFGAGVLARHAGKLTELGGFIDVLRQSRRRIAPVCAAWAVTANRLIRGDFERLTSEFAKALEAARPEALLLALHGAQTAESADDVEGHLLETARTILGPRTPIVATLDLHANVTRRMVQYATAIAGYHTYPHVDLYETGCKAARLLLRILAGEVSPVMSFRKLPMIVPAENMQSTSGPFARLIEAAQRYERSGEAEAVSIFGVQPWLDVPEMGCSVVSVTNANPAAEEQVSRLAAAFWDARRQFHVKLTPVMRAIREALRSEGGPVVISESSDSTGSGSPGDSTGVLRPLLEAQPREPAAIFLVDPAAVARAHAAGVGATLSMKIGGAFDRRNSRPVAVRARVRLLSDGRWTPMGRGYNTGIETCMGRSAVLEVGQVRILTAEHSAMTVDPALFRSHGIEPAHMKVVVVKSPNGFRAQYEPLASRIYLVDTPGVSTANLGSLPYRRVPRPIYPLDKGVRYRTRDGA